MSKKLASSIGALLTTLLLSSCGMMAGMMGMGDLMGAMKNMDAVMEGMTLEERQAHMMTKQRETLAFGEGLFEEASLGTNGQTCTSCHPGGGTTGGEVQVPMTDMRLPVPSLVGAAATFPKFKVPNNRVITLSQMNNNCIKMFMQGKPLELNSKEAIALSMYVTSLSNGEQVGVSN